MNQTLIATTGKCRSCGGRVSNIDGKRHTMERLAEIHAVSCAGRGLIPKADLAAAAEDVKAQVTA